MLFLFPGSHSDTQSHQVLIHLTFIKFPVLNILQQFTSEILSQCSNCVGITAQLGEFNHDTNNNQVQWNHSISKISGKSSVTIEILNNISLECPGCMSQNWVHYFIIRFSLYQIISFSLHVLFFNRRDANFFAISLQRII